MPKKLNNCDITYVDVIREYLRINGYETIYDDIESIGRETSIYFFTGLVYPRIDISYKDGTITYNASPLTFAQYSAADPDVLDKLLEKVKSRHQIYYSVFQHRL